MIVSGAFGLIGIEDGIGYEDIYTLTTGGTAPSKPASENVNDYVPSGWYASPQSVTSTKRYQWVCKRSKKNGTWSTWSTPVEYNRYVEDGQDGTDGVGYEYCYKATQYNVRPNIPTSEASGAGIPTGWSSSAPDISAINAYIWESYRTVQGSYRSYWQTPRLKYRWSYDGAQGSKGARMRMTVWKSGERYLQGAEGEDFYDIVIKGTQLSLCIKTHTADSSNAPDISTTHWESAQQWAFIATQLFIAGKIITDKITADLIDADGITAKNADISGTITADRVYTPFSFKASMPIIFDPSQYTNNIIVWGSALNTDGNWIVLPSPEKIPDGCHLRFYSLKANATYYENVYLSVGADYRFRWGGENKYAWYKLPPEVMTEVVAVNVSNYKFWMVCNPVAENFFEDFPE